MYQKQIPKITHNLQHNNSSVCTKNIPKIIHKISNPRTSICTKNYTQFPTPQLNHMYQENFQKSYTISNTTTHSYVTKTFPKIIRRICNTTTYPYAPKKFPKLYTNLQHNSTCPYVPKLCNTNIPPYVPRIVHRFSTQQYIHVYQKLYTKFSTQQLIHIYKKLYTISTQQLGHKYVLNTIHNF